MQSNGNVGIGTTGPTRKLDVRGSASIAAVLNIESTETAGRGWLTQMGPYVNMSTDNSGVWYHSWGTHIDGSTNAWVRDYMGALPSTAFGISTIGDFFIQSDTSTAAGVPSYTKRVTVTNAGNVGIGTTAPDRALEINHATGGNLRLTYNDANGTAATYADFLMSAAGVLSITPAGSAPGIVIPALLTINTAAYTWPAAVGAGGTQLTDVAGNGTLSWGAAGSLRVWKDVVRRWDDPSAALQAMMAVSVYDFRYKVGKGTGDATTLYTGVMAEEAPWAMHFGGTVLSPISTFGYSVLAIQALQAQIEDLKTRLAKYESGENNG
jgi:hypothetical protein